MKKVLIGTVAFAAAMGAQLTAAPAHAAPLNTASVSGGVLTALFTDNDSSSFIDIDQVGTAIVIRNRYGWLDPGPGCERVDGRAVRCALDGLTSVTVDGGNGTDYITKTASLPGTLAGGPGNDSIKGGPAVGGPESNHLIGGDGADYLTGGRNGDLMDGGLGADTFASDGGYSTVTYRNRTANVVVDANSAGEAGERDSIGSEIWEIEGGHGNDTLTPYGWSSHSLRGGPGDDTLTVGSSGTEIHGGDGDDTIRAMYGAYASDVFHGGEGRDKVTYEGRAVEVSITLDDVANDGSPDERDNVHSDVENLVGGWGDDTLNGNDRANTLIGGGGDDTLTGFGGDDTFDGGWDNDMLVGADGVEGNDVVDGGSDTDTCTADNRDGRFNCEA